jgi:hypothetical protein
MRQTRRTFEIDYILREEFDFPFTLKVRVVAKESRLPSNHEVLHASFGGVTNERGQSPLSVTGDFPDVLGNLSNSVRLL